MTDVFHHYVGRDGKRPKPSVAQIDRENSRAELVAAQVRERIAKAILAEAEVARKRGELISRDTAVKQSSFIMASIRQRLLSLAGSLPRKLAGKSQHEMKLIIDASIRECLTELSKLPERVTQEEYNYFKENGEILEKPEKPVMKRKVLR
jgi:hypothetical protein